MAGPVLICFDGSEGAVDAIRRAAALFPGTQALVLTVAIPAKDELPLDPLSDLIGRFSGLYADWDESVAELARRQAERGCQIATEAGLRAQPVTAAGKPGPTILRVADERDVAVVVLGAGRHTALAGMLGSVAARVVHSADRPVLVIPAHREQR